eukprot:1160937-Pelagomonas_calceolata.AAC.15
MARGQHCQGDNNAWSALAAGGRRAGFTSKNPHEMLHRPESVVEQMHVQELAEIMQNPAALEEVSVWALVFGC